MQNAMDMEVLFRESGIDVFGSVGKVMRGDASPHHNPWSL
jgi:hypothetical protein